MEPSKSATMSFDQAKQNLFTIRARPNAIYAVGKDGELKAISRWNVFGRLYEYAKGNSNTDTVKAVIRESLTSFENSITIKSCFYTPTKSWTFDLYKRNKPFSDIVHSIKSVSLIKKDPTLLARTEDLEKKCGDLYSQIKQVKELYHEIFELPSEVNSSDDPKTVERLFNQYLPNAK